MARRKASGLLIPDEDRPVDLSRMTLQRLEELVGQKPHDVEDRGKWLMVSFPTCTVSFKKW